ncbi:MAG: DnaA/Hda family protein [Gemmatimonadales bacterium]
MNIELNPRFSFEAFVAGPSNQLAVSAARSVAQQPGSAYNPLFVYAPSGLGKTHLLHAIGLAARQLQSNLAVEYLTLEEFVEAFHAAVAQGQGEAFRNRFESVGLVLLDDVQFLSQRLETQSELLRFVTRQLESGRQIVLASDRPPSEIDHLDERLISRFAGGLVVDIGTPEYETRITILRRKAQDRGVTFGTDVLDVAAELGGRNVRELMGYLNKLVAYQAVNDTPISPEAARAVLTGGTAPVATAPAAAPTPPAAPDEFESFLSSVGSALTQQMEAWRKRLHEAAAFWDGQGYRPGRIVQLVEQDTPVGADAAVRQFEADVEQLKALQAEMTELDPTRAGDAVFYDPDRLPEARAMVTAARDGLGPPLGPSAAWAFAGFISAETNRLALTSAQAVAEAPGAVYNPLIVVGPTGTGKTHLLHAIGHALSAHRHALVACLSTQDFMDELVQAMDKDRVDQWRSRYRRASAFLLDDAHLLAGKQRTQEELFHLFNSFVDQGKQLVFTLHAVPRETEGLDDRLVSRFEGGLIADLGLPERELRLAIVQRELQQRTGAVDDSLAAYLADRHAGSLRSVIGMVQRVLEAAETQEQPADVAFARGVLEGQQLRPRRTSIGMRTSGIVVSPSGGVKSREKVIWRWPDVGERILEDFA